MLDIGWIRKNPEALDQDIKRRGLAPTSNFILELDRKYRLCLESIQALQRNRKIISRSRVRSNDKGADVSSMKHEISTLKEEIGFLKKGLLDLLASVPNILDTDVPDGNSSRQNQIIRSWGNPRSFDFKPECHADLGKKLKMMDFDTATKISGSRFVILTGELAALERALISFMLDVHTKFNGYVEISPPYLVREESAFGTAHLPRFSQDFFRTTNEHWLISTAEIPLVNIVRQSFLSEDELPKRFVASSPCFRLEAGSSGKDSHGLIRQHQFHKVELVSVTNPSSSIEEHDRMIRCSEHILRELKLPYRLVLLCSGDTGFSARKTYDLEVWIPGEGRYIEISSCSNCWDYQARRLKARYRPLVSNGRRNPSYVHTLNGSGVAIGRALVAVLENYQQNDGSVVVPNVLRQYMHGTEVIAPCS